MADRDSTLRSPFRALRKFWPFKGKEKEDDPFLREIQTPGEEEPKGVFGRFGRFMGFGQKNLRPRAKGEHVFTDMVRDVTGDASDMINSFVRNWPVAPGRKPMRPYQSWRRRPLVDLEASDLPFLSEEVLKLAGFKLLWAQKNLGEIRVIGVSIQDGLVLLKTEQDEVYALDATSGYAQWIYDFEAPVESGPVLTDEGMYAVAGGVLYYVAEPATGVFSWRRPMPFSARTEPIDFGQNLIFGSGLNQVCAYSRKRQSVDWCVPTNGPISSEPLRNNDRLVFGSEGGYLYKLGLFNHKYDWKFHGQGDFSSPPVLDLKANPQRVYVGTRNQYLYGIDYTLGNISKVSKYREWEVLLNGPITHAPVLYGAQHLFVVADKGGLHGIDRQKATELWFVPGITQVVAKSAEAVYVLNTAREFLALNPTTGEVIWRYDVTPFEFFPYAGDELLVVMATNSGQVFALQPPVAGTPVEDIEALKAGGEQAAAEGAKPPAEAEAKPAEESPAEAEERPAEESPAEEGGGSEGGGGKEGAGEE
ncbi:MAG: PQQ-binding-like beta-propeller repeat protein [Planctomycetes bacterium]|nr:PQQ-binding-like beta-propeller repeat protein [Planctomycetota bacterium]